jgi:competence protein ComEC
MGVNFRALWTTLILLLAAIAQALTIHFVDVGQGDAIVIDAGDGRAVVIDGGPDPATLLDYLRRIGITSVPLVIATHAHADHIVGLPAVIDAYRPAFFLDNGIVHTTRAYERLLTAVERSGAQVLAPTERTLSLGDVTLQILPPPGRPSWGHNDNSVGVIVAWGDFRASFTGDAEPRLFAHWLATIGHHFTPVQVHKASHHASRNGDDAAALARLRPRLVIVPVGAGNDYGHPHAEALARYAAVGADVLRTDLHGTVRIEARRDGTFEIVTARGAAPASASASPPAPPATPSPPATAPPEAARADCVDLNRASAEALTAIVHVGPARARAIIAARPFARVDDLQRVDGIGAARLRDILAQGLACVP